MLPPCEKTSTMNKRKKSIKIKDRVMALFSREQTDEYVASWTTLFPFTDVQSLTSLFPLPPPSPARPRTAPAPQSQSQWKAAEGEEISDSEDISSERCLSFEHFERDFGSYKTRSTNSLRSLSPSQSTDNLFELAGDETFPKHPPPPPPSPHLHDDARANFVSSTTPHSTNSRASLKEDSFIRLADRKLQDPPKRYKRLDLLSESYSRLDLSSDPAASRSPKTSDATSSRPPKVDLKIDTGRDEQFPVSHSAIDTMLARITDGQTTPPRTYSQLPPAPAPTRPLPALPPRASSVPTLTPFPPRYKRATKVLPAPPAYDNQPRKDSAASIATHTTEKGRKDSLVLPPSPQDGQAQKPLPSTPPTPQHETTNASLQLAEQLQKAFQQWAEQVEKAPSFEVTLKINSNAM